MVQPLVGKGATSKFLLLLEVPGEGVDTVSQLIDSKNISYIYNMLSLQISNVIMRGSEPQPK